ncbi:hypothetical protein BpHYR1_051353 [Brachionus plicatilis]|uniref:Uncharacterized protein n=1 Tax=Brachionus plicatilis TaxID=10195 RepID=A0A3M7PWA0_BRAPC|nr:hypothetical protein BpHYR1_051353 [Brachionus plicatilis]
MYYNKLAKIIKNSFYPDTFNFKVSIKGIAKCNTNLTMSKENNHIFLHLNKNNKDYANIFKHKI